MQRLRTVALRWLPLVLIVVVGLALSIYASFRSAQNGEAQAWAEFERQATGDVDALKARINASFGAVTALAALYKPATAWSRASLSGLPKRSWLDDPSVQTLEWAQVVAEGERVGVERRLTAEYGFGVHFTERDDGRLTVARERSRYVPVAYITPLQGNQAALGFDLASEPTRRAAVEQAERTGLPVASGRILSVQQANEYSFLLFWPIFTTAGQPHRMTGLVLGLFRIDDIVAAATTGPGR